MQTYDAEPAPGLTGVLCGLVCAESAVTSRSSTCSAVRPASARFGFSLPGSRISCDGVMRAPDGGNNRGEPRFVPVRSSWAAESQPGITCPGGVAMPVSTSAGIGQPLSRAARLADVNGLIDPAEPQDTERRFRGVRLCVAPPGRSRRPRAACVQREPGHRRPGPAGLDSGQPASVVRRGSPRHLRAFQYGSRRVPARGMRRLPLRDIRAAAGAVID